MSLGMDFTRRRMVAGVKKGPKYVWAVYDFAYVRDDASATTGSVTLSQTLRKMAASAYTVNEGGFTLTGAVTTQVQHFQVGQFIVNIATNTGDNVTSGQYLYEVTGTSGYWTRTIQYKRYGVKAAKGDTELYRIESDTPDYPMDGEQDGLWYVMIKGLREVFVWDVYQATFSYGYKETRSSKSSSFISTSSSKTFLVSTSYTFDPYTGYYTLVNPTSVTVRSGDSAVTDVKNYLKEKYSMNSSTNGTHTGMTYVTGDGTLEYEFVFVRRYEYSRTTDETLLIPSGKGEPTGNVVESSDDSAYPQDGAQSDYWYTYSHSYMQEFDNR